MLAVEHGVIASEVYTPMEHGMAPQARPGLAAQRASSTSPPTPPPKGHTALHKVSECKLCLIGAKQEKEDNGGEGSGGGGGEV